MNDQYEIALARPHDLRLIASIELAAAQLLRGHAPETVLNEVTSERVLSDAELVALWPRLDPALKLILLTGQRPGEVAAMQAAHIEGGWWQMPGQPAGDWPGTKNSKDHRVALSEPVQALIEIHLVSPNSANRSGLLLRQLVTEFALARATPHDLRRTCLTKITGLGFGRDAMDRIANHRKGGITDVYDRHSYADEDRRIMAAVARHVSSLVEGLGNTNVVALRSAVAASTSPQHSNF